MIIFTNALTGEQTEIPDQVNFNGRKLTFSRSKTSGVSVGGFYIDNEGKTYIVKFLEGESFKEKIFNDLAGICIGEAYVPSEVGVGDGKINGEDTPCFVASLFQEYQDFESFSRDEERQKASKLHPIYSFCAMFGNDDINEGNVGLYGEVGTPAVVDLGFHPNFMHPQRPEETKRICTNLASFIGHSNAYGTAFMRRRYFGFSGFLNPLKRFHPKNLVDKDISYGSILKGLVLIIDNQEKISKALDIQINDIDKNSLLTPDKKEELKNFIQEFKKILIDRIKWVKEFFGEDLEKIKAEPDSPEYDVKWRIHPKFMDLMEQHFEISKTSTKTEHSDNIKAISQILGVDSNIDLIIAQPLDETQKEQIRKCGNFLLHNAVMNNDVKMANWLLDNDLEDINRAYWNRNHNYQYFRSTPLAMASTIANDNFVYRRHIPTDHTGMINLLADKFYEKNGPRFVVGKQYVGEIGPIENTFIAHKNYLDSAATIIQTAAKNRNAVLKNPTVERLKPMENGAEL